MKIKVCGVTNEADAQKAAELGVDAVGFNFYEVSPRYIRPELAAAISRVLPPSVERIGVFVNAEPETVAEIALAAGLDAVQLHGDESPDTTRRTRELSGTRVIKAFRKAGDLKIDAVAAHRADAILIDTFSDSAYGGTGKSFEWAEAKDLFKNFDRAYVAGGLDPTNVEEAVSALRPYGVDVCSGVESAPGTKDHQLLEAFVSEARRAAEGGSSEGRSPFEPDEEGYFGEYGGRFVPETLAAPLEELTAVWTEAIADPAFRSQYRNLLKDISGRPTPLSFASRLTDLCGGAKIYLKREDLNHTGAHKINNAIGQALLARRMGKTRIIAETGAGQHGVATATVCAQFGLECVIFMGSEDIRRQAPNVYRMQLLGAEVRAVESGSRTLKDAINEALRDWVTNVSDTHYLLGSALGPHPYPLMVRTFQSVIGEEAREQALEKEGRLPDLLIACVGGGSNSLGLFHPFLGDETVRMHGVEAGGRGDSLGDHAARFSPASGGRVGVLQGTKSYILQDDNGQISPTHSVSAGLDYASIGPELAYLHDIGRVAFTTASDDAALEAFHILSKTEGMIPALESAHAVAHCLSEAKKMRKDEIIVVGLSGRGDKDVPTVLELAGEHGGRQ